MPMLFDALMARCQAVDTFLVNNPLENLDPTLVLPVAQEFAARTEIHRAGFRWWADALSFDTWGRSRALFTLSGIARDAGIPYNVLANLTPEQDEGDRAVAIIAAKRDAMLGHVFRHAEERYRATAAQLASIPEAAARPLADAETCARANGPLTYVVDIPTRVVAARSTDPITVAAQPREVMTARTAAYADLRCGACGEQWRPRTDRPKRCPHCQARLIWDEE